MPPRFMILILASALSAAALTVWIGSTAAGSSEQSGGFWFLAPIVTLGSFLLWRYIVGRQK